METDTPQVSDETREFQQELLAAERSEWQPRCVSRAFASSRDEDPFAFTMQAWIDLEAVQSPFLLGQFPNDESYLYQFADAFQAFGYKESTPDQCTEEQLVLLGHKMIRAIAQGFSMHLKLAAPEGFRAKRADDGMGSWLPVMACLKSQLNFSLAEARSLLVEQAFALMAGHRCNEGWRVDGETYAQRDVPEGE